MAVGQGVLTARARHEALCAAEERLEQRAVEVGQVHAALLRDVLVMHREFSALGMVLSTQAQVALLLRCSETRAGQLLHDALGLAELPQGLEALEDGRITVEQSSVVVTQLAPVTPPTRLALWQRLLEQLAADRARGVVRPPARLTELLKRWVAEVDAEGARARRERAEDERTISYRRRHDGLTDILLLGVRPTLAQAVLQRVRAESAPVTLYDERPADQRRHDAAVDLLLGRSGSGCASTCGCRPGTGAPCGAQMQVLVPLGAGLGTTDEAAELVGHGPIDAGLLQELLLNAPRLQPVFVDAAGVPVAVGDEVLQPEPGDPLSLRRALEDLAALRPQRLWPRYSGDHGPASGSDPPPPPDERTRGGSRLAAFHLPGAYRVPGRLRRLLEVRAPRCEFPGCGARAVRCDAEHDVAWPEGPTCSCNLGPCCRRHHRIKQEGWSKSRGASSEVRWTSPSGRTWLSPSQHVPPAAPRRALPRVAAPATQNPWDELSPWELEQTLWELADRPDDPLSWVLRAHEREPVSSDDPLRDRILHGHTRWTLDLDDPYRWEPATDAA